MKCYLVWAFAFSSYWNWYMFQCLGQWEQAAVPDGDGGGYVSVFSTFWGMHWWCMRLADLHVCINFFDIADLWSCYMKGLICCWNLRRILWKTEGSIPFSQSKASTTCFWIASGRGEGRGGRYIALGSRTSMAYPEGFPAWVAFIYI